MNHKRLGHILASILTPMAALMMPHGAVAQNPTDQADAAADKQFMVGVGVVQIQSPFKGEGTLVYPAPLISAKFGPAYIEGIEAGLKFQPIPGPISPFASAFVAGRMQTGRDRRDFTVDAGVRVSIGGKFGELTGEYRRDISGEFKGGEFQIRYAYPISMGDFTLTPSAQVNWLDKETANHMYGVTAAQRARAITKQRKVILPVAPILEKARNIGGVLTGTYSVGGGVTLIGVLNSTYLDKPIRNSAAIDKKWESSAILGVTYSF